jgi:hypothetical protein
LPFTAVHLTLKANVPGAARATFGSFREDKGRLFVSKLLKAESTLDATLVDCAAAATGIACRS